MATARQIAANRLNAQKSTGPVTDEGKLASRGNAVKHGLAGDGLVVPDDDQAAIQLRMIEWRPNFQLETPAQAWLFEQMVVNSIRLDRCVEQEAAIRLSESQRASSCWDDDRQDEAAELAGKLSKRPVQISRRLQRTRQGADWMIMCWRSLAAILDRGGEWTEAQKSLALDLMGTDPALRDDTPLENPRAIAAREIAHLERRKTQSLNQFDEFERSAALAGLATTPSPALNNLRRYEASCRRQYLWAREQLEQCRQEFASPERAPAADPETPAETSTTNRTQWQSGQDEPFPIPSFVGQPREIHPRPCFDSNRSYS